MAGFANITLMGNLGKDPETRYTPSGAMNVSFNVAVTRRFNDKENTTWYRVTAWTKLAETLDRLAQQGALAKGRQVVVNGRIEQREYQAQDGTSRYSLDVTANEVMLAGGGRQDGESGRGGYEAESNAPIGAEDLDDVPF